jgi:O-antigen/teichoic acid export membrane protein
MNDSSSRPASAEARQAGRGVLYIAFAKLYFMVAGAIIEFRLPLLLGRVGFGAYGTVASTVSPLNNVLITGSIQAVSRFTAQKPELARGIQAAGFRMHLWVGLPMAALFIAGAPLVARYFYHDPTKTGPLMLAGLIVAGYAFYAVLVGTANGQRHFHKQAALDVCMATLRAVGILGLTTAGFGLYGAIGGWVAATGVILIIASFIVGLPGRAARRAAAGRVTARPLVTFFASLAVYLALLNLIMSVDQMLLKRLTTAWFLEHADQVRAALDAGLPGWLAALGVGELDPARAADAQVGYYRAVQNLARLSYQAIIAATFVVFPLVSRSTFVSDRDATRRYVETTCRYSLIFATAMAVVFAANPFELLSIPYPEDYASLGAPALVALALGNVAFSVLAIVGTILNGAGLTREAIVVAAVTLVAAAAGNWIVIPMFEPGRDMLLAAACATGGAMVLGAALGGWLLRARLGAFVPLGTVIRVLFGICVAVAAGRAIPASTPLATLGEAAAIGLIFLLTLVVTRELTGADLRGVVSVLRRRKGGS